jgi:hypothetical protein
MIPASAAALLGHHVLQVLPQAFRYTTKTNGREEID